MAGMMRAGAVLASELGIPAYTKRNAWKLGGMAAGAIVGGASFNNARKNGLNAGNGIGMAIGGAGFIGASAGTGLRTLLQTRGKSQIGSLNSSMKNLRNMAGAGTSNFQDLHMAADMAQGMSRGIRRPGVAVKKGINNLKTMHANGMAGAKQGWNDAWAQGQARYAAAKAAKGAM